MVLKFWNGRKNPKELMKDCGFEGPVIIGIKAFSSTCLDLKVWFRDKDTYEKAKAATGWKGSGNLSLEADIFEGMTKVLDNINGSGPSYYMGLELQSSIPLLK